MILGLFTDTGIQKTQELLLNQGWKLVVEKFGVSSTAGALNSGRDTADGVEWYNGAISSRVAINQNTLQITCTIPAGITVGLTDIKEVYLYGLDNSNVPFMLALGQPSNTLVYDPDGTLTMKIQISLVNVNLTALYTFTNTMAVELEDHNEDPNAHFEYVEEMRHAGIKVDAGSFNSDYEGALYDKRAEFDGTKAAVTVGGVVFQSTYNGTEGNVVSLTFDGIKTTDQIRSAWNLANPKNTIEHDDITGAIVIAAQVANLSGGTYNVGEKDVVYKATDGIYKKAIADGVGAAGKPFGLAYRGERCVKPLGLHTYTHSFVIGKNVYLSSSIAGALTTIPTSTKIGYVHGINTIATNLGVPSEDFADEFDAIVTDIAGIKNYATTQQAIDAVASGSRIFVNKLEELTATLTTSGKRLDFFFKGKNFGWKRYAGTQEQQLITFSAVPTSGTWRLVYSPILETIDLPYNATALAVQNAINTIFPSNLCTVTGNTAIGFSISHAQLQDVPNPYFTDAGQNEIQRFAFSNIPDNGSFAVKRSAESSAALAWNDNAALFETYIEALSDVNDVLVSSSFLAGHFDVEFTGVDGGQPQPQMTVATVPVNSLALGVSGTIITPSTLQQGKYAANALKNGINPVAITANIIVEGSAIGSTKAITVGAAYTTFKGLGVIQNFTDGIDLNGFANCTVEMVFDNTTNPILNTGLTPVRDYHSRNSIGLSEKKEITVGSFGDYKTLALAYAAANVGDKIVVLEDQTITTAQSYSKEIEIEFLHNSKINVLSNIAGAVITLGAKVRTRNFKLLINHASSFTTAAYFTAQRGHHEDFQIEVATGVTITNMVLIDAGCGFTYIDGALNKNSATVTNKVVDNASVSNNNYNFRDITGVINSLGVKTLKYVEYNSSGNLTVPADVTELFVEACGGGGGGGSGGGDAGSGGSTGGGGGGQGAIPFMATMKVTPSSVISVVIGAGGNGGAGVGGASNGNDGNNGGATSVGSYIFWGGKGGEKGYRSGASLITLTKAGAGGGRGVDSQAGGLPYSFGGDAGDAFNNSPPTGSGNAGQKSLYASGGAGGVSPFGGWSGAYGGGGGGGGAGRSFGGDGSGGTDGGAPPAGGSAAANSGAGGGGSGGAAVVPAGGNGGSGYARISYLTQY